MSIVRVPTACVLGIRAVHAHVEVSVAPAAEFAVHARSRSRREVEERVTCALRASGHTIVPGAYLFDLAAPDPVPGGDRHLDLPVAVATLAASGGIGETWPRWMMAGELALDGALRPVRGAVLEGVDLPAITRALLALSRIAGHTGEAGMLGIAAVLIAIPRVLAHPVMKPRADAIVLRLPVLGRLAQVRALSNFMRYFALLLSTGSIQEVDAIELAAQTSPNLALADRLAAAAREVAMGTAKISAALQRTGVVPPTWVQVMATGEKSGQLAQLTEFAAARLEEEAEDAVAGVRALSEPLALTIVALAVGFLVVGLYAPMANLYQVLLR
jgi:hypothetical protein